MCSYYTPKAACVKSSRRLVLTAAEPVVNQGMQLFTIGHSTRTLEELVGMLTAHGVRRLADVRTVPRSRHNPQFNAETLPPALAASGIDYASMKGLGGLRRPRKDSPNAAWCNAGFRGFADYMQTGEFETELDRLIELAKEKPTAIMCAESVPWRCHRSLIADALTVRGIDVFHIMTDQRANPHKLTRFAVVEGTRITYPPEQASLDLGQAPAN